MSDPIKAIQEYARAVRLQNELNDRAAALGVELLQAIHDRQDRWREIKGMINDGKIQPGVYTLRGPGLHSDGILIELHRDYPEIFPLFR